MQDRSGRTRVFYVEAEVLEEFNALPKSGRRALALYAEHADADGVAKFTQAEVAERLRVSRMALQEGLTALEAGEFVVQVGVGRVLVNDQKVGSFFHRRPPYRRPPELEARILAAAETRKKRQAAGRAAYHSRPPRRPPVAVDPADVPDWKKTDD